MADVEWRRVPSYPDLEVSSDGRVRRNGVDVPGWKYCGYRLVAAKNQLGRKSVPIHRLVAEAFIGPLPEGKEVNHINSVRDDNRTENLEYLTRRENIWHAMRAGKHPSCERSGQAKLTAGQVRELIALQGHISSLDAVSRFGISRTHVYRIWRGERWRGLTVSEIGSNNPTEFEVLASQPRNSANGG